MHTDHLSNSAILSNDYVLLLNALCTCMQMKGMVSQSRSI